ncbi:MAG: MogA/MoaB family molybdenum cofactor biosynthesis protein [Spirochaetes bacterium]|uniref:MogA/MoaB family molybdenum cofactor biosynthesis protein n=1 Tax=Candidatus Ornithospirochaeta stercoravium TaxID=2840897 RepID=A0A9D9IB55_9SPIO|nr:MogA/MoaB family molybdenum cofactor biosynthesis protein [Candidatus Ornithospirochaeta stercoravium]
MNRVFILTISDRASRKEKEDLTGPELIKNVKAAGFEITGYRILPDEKDAIRDEIMKIADNDTADLILTAGGIGFAERDVTPEATAEAADRFAQGLAEAIRNANIKTSPNVMLTRGIAVIRKKAIIINLPGTPKGAREAFDVFARSIVHGIARLKGNNQM